jgi:uncharacterized membrane protein
MLTPSSKPIHPAAVHFPIAFLSLAFGLDVLHKLSASLPNVISTNLPATADVSRASYWLLSLGLITAVPALITGIREAVVQVSRSGMFEVQEYSTVMREKFKPMIAHAVFNNVMLAVTTFVWYRRRAALQNSVAGKLGFGATSYAAAAYEPKTWMVVVEGLMFVVLMMAANIGGVLAYNFGMGMSIGSSNKKKT